MQEKESIMVVWCKNSLRITVWHHLISLMMPSQSFKIFIVCGEALIQSDQSLRNFLYVAKALRQQRLSVQTVHYVSFCQHLLQAFLYLVPDAMHTRGFHYFWKTGSPSHDTSPDSSVRRVSAPGNGRSRVRSRATTYQSRKKWY